MIHEITNMNPLSLLVCGSLQVDLVPVVSTVQRHRNYVFAVVHRRPGVPGLRVCNGGLHVPSSMDSAPPPRQRQGNHGTCRCALQAHDGNYQRHKGNASTCFSEYTKWPAYTIS